MELTDNHAAKILSVFHSSKSQANVDCEIVDGKIIYKPDTNLITRYEHVTNYVYVYNGNQSLDVREFIYVVDLSKIDETSLEVKEVYDQSYADLLAEFEQALSDYKDNLPQADSVRADIDAILNQFSVDSQAKLNQYDDDAQQVIADNQTAFDLAESVRQGEFDTSQSEKQQQFDNAQTARQESYDQFQSLINEAESSRVQVEGQRESAESNRVEAEGQRESSESIRVQSESQRMSAESNRVNAESERVLAEDERENAEEQRKTDHANRSAELDGKADKIVIENLANLDTLNSSLDTTYHIENDEIVVTQFSTAHRELDMSLTDEPRHTYYALVEMKATDINNSLVFTGMSNVIPVYHSGSGEWETLSTASTTIINPTGNPTIRFLSSGRSGDFSDDSIRIRKPILINLTETFGAGNEPTKEEMDEFIKVTGYIDSENGLHVKEMLGHLLNSKANKKQEDWKPIPLTNGWRNHLSAYSSAEFYKDEFGVVHLRGHISGGTGGTIGYMPVGYRPAQFEFFLILANLVTGTLSTRTVGLYVSNSGEIRTYLSNNEMESGYSSMMSLSQISYKAEV